MTDEQRYMELLKALGELLADNNSTISLANYRIKTLEDKLAKAEKQIEDLKKGNENE